MTTPLPEGTILRADPGLRVRDGGRILFGGAPLRILRLTETGASAVQGWLAGRPPPSSSGATTLARRLIDAGMVHPVLPERSVTAGPTEAAHPPEPAAAAAALTVVIPVKDDPDGLAATLASLGPYPVVVVDDGSAVPVTAPEPATEGVPATVTVRRRDRSGGPGVARQDGLADCTTPLVAFIDAAVTLEADDLARLVRWFDDPDVVAVAPRVACRVADDPIARYDQHHSPLDLGPAPASVGPGRALTYVPTACLVVRRRVLDVVGGFDPDLRYGEDVDLVWRLVEHGTVRYDPDVVARHPARPSVGALARQRFGYGSAAGPLARRHGRQLAPVRLSPWSGLVLALALVGRPGMALVAAVGTAAALRRKLEGRLPDPGTEAVLLTARGHGWAAQSVADAAVRAWWPLPVLAAVCGWRRPLRWAWAWALARRAWRARGSASERAEHVFLATVDDLAYGTGVWVGAWRARAIDAVQPRFDSWPDD